MGSNEEQKVEITVENIGVSSFQTQLAQAVNDTYSYANNSLFYSIIPAYYRDYAVKYIRPACQWMDGFVPNIHNPVTGIISTRIGSKLITGLTKQIVGEKLVFKLKDKNIADPTGDDTLQFASKWAEENNITKAVYSAVGFALGLGTSYLKINKTASGELWWEAVRFDNAFVLSSFRGEIRDATFLIRNYTDTREGKSNQQFFLCEHRYWKEYEKPVMVKQKDGTVKCLHRKGEKYALVEYRVHRALGTSANNLMPSNMESSSINWEEIPNDIRRMIKSDYGTLRIGEPQLLGLSNLGVFALLNGEIDLSVPTGSNFGESMLVGIQDDLIAYELARSYQIRDMYLGKGTVYVPKGLTLGQCTPSSPAATVLGGIGDGAIETIPGADPDKQSITVQQFNIRVAEWQTAMENALKSIAVKWSMSPKILASFLTNGQAQMTATQIDSEDDMSIAFIYHTRAYFKNAINQAMEATLNYYGRETNISIEFASPSLVNKDRLLERVIKERQEGLIDTEEAIRILNPDLDEATLQTKIDKAIQKEQEMMMMQMQPQDSSVFGNEPGLEGDAADGTTDPTPPPAPIN